jgi:hypothetical protein
MPVPVDDGRQPLVGGDGHQPLVGSGHPLIDWFQPAVPDGYVKVADPAMPVPVDPSGALPMETSPTFPAPGDPAAEPGSILLGGGGWSGGSVPETPPQGPPKTTAAVVPPDPTPENPVPADPNATIMPDATGDVLPAGQAPAPPQLQPGETVPHGDGTTTVGTRLSGNVRLTDAEAEALAKAAALSNDPAAQTGREAANAGFLFNPDLNMTPAQRVEAASTGKAPDRGSILGTDEAIRFERNKASPEKAAADLAKVEAEANAAAQKGEQDLRKEYTDRDETKRHVVVRDRFADMQKALERKNGFGDTTAIYAYIKMLDPTSSVMGGEQATATNAPGMVESTRAYVNQLLETANSGKYTDQGRKQLLEEGRAIYGRSAQEQAKINEIYRKSARLHNVDPDLVVPPDDPASPQTSPPASPTAPAAPAEPGATPSSPAAPADDKPPTGWTQEQWDVLTPEEKQAARGG